MALVESGEGSVLCLMFPRWAFGYDEGNLGEQGHMEGVFLYEKAGS